MKRRPTGFGLALFVTAALAPPAGAEEDVRRLARDIFQELVEIDTTEARGNTTTAARGLAARLKAAGLPDEDVLVVGPDERHGNLVARLRGTGARRPLLLIAHLDVVDARREDWSVDPFKFLEKDGYYWGRGTTDIKGGVTILVTNLIRLVREKYRPDRDLILALTAGEETGIADGIEWLLRERRPLIDSVYCVNVDGGDFQLKDGKRRLVAVQASEKLSVNYRLEAADRGGHSSLPRPENPIYRVAGAVSRVAAFEFPVELNEVTRTYFQRMSALETGQTAADMKAIARTPSDPAVLKRLSGSPYVNALVRTTCVATRLEAGHADNALPQKARKDRRHRAHHRVGEAAGSGGRPTRAPRVGAHAGRRERHGGDVAGRAYRSDDGDGRNRRLLPAPVRRSHVRRVRRVPRHGRRAGARQGRAGVRRVLSRGCRLPLPADEGALVPSITAGRADRIS
jgi:acetylornithine deacetylase/succinyl-diaminopimelate desuccinylase-like protein